MVPVSLEDLGLNGKCKGQGKVVLVRYKGDSTSALFRGEQSASCLLRFTVAERTA